MQNKIQMNLKRPKKITRTLTIFVEHSIIAHNP